MPFHGVQHQASHLKILLLHNHVSLKYCFIHRVIIQERVVTRSHDVHFPAKKCHPSNSCRGVQRKLHNGWKLDSTGKHTLYQHKCRDGQMIELGEQQQNVQNYWKEKAKPQQREMFKSVFKRCHAVLESSRIMTWK